MDNVREVFGSRLSYFDDAYLAIEGSEALVIMTEWNEFRVFDMDRISEIMEGNVIFDCRNIYKNVNLQDMGFSYHSFGR
jgi:UDPglucose 6-dehydrogenase